MRCIQNDWVTVAAAAVGPRQMKYFAEWIEWNGKPHRQKIIINHQYVWDTCQFVNIGLYANVGACVRELRL